MMDTMELAAVAGRYHALRGLLMVPAGVLLIGAGVFNMGSASTAPYFVVVVVLSCIGYLLVDRYYRTTFGAVRATTGATVRVVVHTIAGAVLIGIGITIDGQLDLPITAYGLAFAISLLVYYRVLVGLRLDHWLVLGALAVLSVIPVWGRLDDKASMAMVLIGTTTIVLGLLDHRDLMNTMDRARLLAVGDHGADLV
jgi:hypothetical protein